MAPRRYVSINDFFDMANRIRGKKRVSAHIADFRRDILKNENFPFSANHMKNGPGFIRSWTSLEAAFHCFFSLIKGVGHLGGFGS